MRTIVLHPVIISLFYFLVAVVVVIRYLAEGHLGLTGTELGTLYSVNQFTAFYL